MKRLLFSLMLIAYLASCNNELNEGDGILTIPNDDIEQLINEQKGEFDSSQLMGTLCTTALETEYYLINDGKEKNMQHKQIIFNEDGTCRILLHRVTPKVVDINDDGTHVWEDVDEYYYSRKYFWTFDNDTNTITTTDEYNNYHHAKILYLSEYALIYEGCIGDELHSIKNGEKYYTLGKFVDDREGWMKQATSYDVEFRGFACENDMRLYHILELIDSAKGNIDDSLFTYNLLNKVVNIMPDVEGTESGAEYGDIRMYVYDNGAYLYSDSVEGDTLQKLYIMMEDGTYRHCFPGWQVSPHNTTDKMLYQEYEWNYDEHTNMLNTQYSDYCGAEVLYVDDDKAILKGHINGRPFTGEYGLFLIDFNQYDRSAILEEYNTNANEYHSDIN